MTKDEEIEVLKERIIQLEELLAGTSSVPIRFGLSGLQTKLFGMLMRREEVGRFQAMDFIYGGCPSEPDAQILSVVVNHLRKKLRPFDVDIKTIWGRGWYLTSDAKAKVNQYLELQRA